LTPYKFERCGVNVPIYGFGKNRQFRIKGLKKISKNFTEKWPLISAAEFDRFASDLKGLYDRGITK